MGVCQRLDFDNITLIIPWGMTYIYGAFEFLCNSIGKLRRHVWYHYHTQGHPIINISSYWNIM